MEVLKTVKMYVGGKFIRSESGITKVFKDANKNDYARVCIASTKDFRNAVTIAKSGYKNWDAKSAYNRSQIIYRMAEMTQARSEEFTLLLKKLQGLTTPQAKKEVQSAIDTFIYYAGWCDKYQQVLGAVNPVAGPYHNFTTPESMGVVVHIDEDLFSFQKWVDDICAILVSGNSAISFLSQSLSPIVSNIGEVIATSDVPAGVINLLSGDFKSVQKHISSHMEVNAISFQNKNEKKYFEMRSSSVDNMKRMIPYSSKTKSLDAILNFVEQKTVWHPIEVSMGSSGSY